MPTSSHVHVSRMLDHIVRLQPQSILDVGVGFGKWGFLCREFLDVAQGRYDPATWTTRIDGVEVNEKYRNSNHDIFYNHIYYAPIQDVLPSLGAYDLVIMGDVIEHFDKETGRQLLEGLRQHSKYVLISSPTWFFQQGHDDNPYQEHRSLWRLRDFSGLRFDYDEYLSYIFVALIEGDLAHPLHLDPRPSQLAYRWTYVRQHPKLAVMLKTFAHKVIYRFAVPRTIEQNGL